MAQSATMSPTKDNEKNKIQSFGTNNKSKNVNSKERIASVIGGGALALYGISNRNLTGLALALLGGGLVYRGATGHCNIYKALKIDTAHSKGNAVSVSAGTGIRVDKSITINKSSQELYSFWKNFENLPLFMHHLESVNVTDEHRSHWVAKAPAGATVEWDAEIINEKENELIAWRSLENSDIPNAGSVRFIPTSNGRGTEVKVSLSYEPPAGKIGSLFAKLFGEEPSQQIEEDLRRFKQLMETGEIATIEGQPSGRVRKDTGQQFASATA